MPKTVVYKGLASNKAQHLLLKIYLWLGIWLLPASLAVALLAGVSQSVSAFVGGVIFLIPNSFFAYRSLQPTASKSASETLLGMYANAFWKLMLSGVLFALAFTQLRQIELAYLFGAYIVLQLLTITLQFKSLKHI